jgi:ribonuclease E
MLVNATQQEELRVALVDGQKLYDLSIEIPSREQKKANIYKARIARVEPSLEACFVDYGAQRHGFLPLKEIAKEYFRSQPQGGRMLIRELVSEGQELLVQVEKEERGNKGAALTTFISLAGRFLVLMPNSPRAGGVSRRIEGEDRDQMREVMNQLQVPESMGAIVRTAGVGRAVEELQWDLDNLRTQWQAIDEAAKGRAAPFLVYQEGDAVTRSLRDYLADDVGEVLVDDLPAFHKAQEYMQRFMPGDAQRKLKLYTDDIPLFTRYQIENQIESAYAHKVQLPSGGSLVVDYTEALVSIDINSARATRGGDIETTATNTNLEAADEIARQLRIRDIGGLIVIDFIDMEEGKNQRAVEDRLREAMKMDRARIQIGRLSRFGLLEMSRQRLRPSLGDSSHLVCPRCVGIGSIRSVESLALSILRLIGEDARKDRTARVVAQVPVEVATYLVNEKREWLRTVEEKAHIEIVLVPNPHMQTPEYTLRRVRDDEAGLPENMQVSYQMPAKPVTIDPTLEKQPVAQVPAVAAIQPAPAPVIAQVERPAPVQVVVLPPKGLGFFARLMYLFTGDASEPAPAAATRDARPARGEPRREHGDRSRSRGRGGSDRGAERGRDSRRDGRDNRDGARGEARRDGRRDEAPRDASRAEGARSEAPRSDGARGATGRGEGPRAGSGRGDEPRHEPQRGGRGEGRGEAPRQGSGRGEEPRGDAPRQEPRREPPRNEPARNEPARADGNRAEAARNDTPGAVDGNRAEAPRNDAPRADGPGEPRRDGERDGRRSRRGGRRRRGGGGGGGGGNRDGVAGAPREGMGNGQPGNMNGGQTEGQAGFSPHSQGEMQLTQDHGNDHGNDRDRDERDEPGNDPGAFKLPPPPLGPQGEGAPMSWTTPRAPAPPPAAAERSVAADPAWSPPPAPVAPAAAAVPSEPVAAPAPSYSAPAPSYSPPPPAAPEPAYAPAPAPVWTPPPPPVAPVVSAPVVQAPAAPAPVVTPASTAEPVPRQVVWHSAPPNGEAPGADRRDE